MALGDRLKNASGKRKDIHVTLLEQNLDMLDVACSANGKTRGEMKREARAAANAKVSENRAPQFMHSAARRIAA